MNELNELEKKIKIAVEKAMSEDSWKAGQFTEKNCDIICQSVSKFFLEEIKDAIVYARLKDSKSIEETIDDYLKSKYKI